MKNKTPASRPRVATKSDRKVTDDADYAYLDESVKNHEYSDWIRVRAGGMGVLLSFGKIRPDNEKKTIFQEILVPLHVANSLRDILTKQMTELQEKGYLRREAVEDEHDNK